MDACISRVYRPAQKLCAKAVLWIRSNPMFALLIVAGTILHLLSLYVAVVRGGLSAVQDPLEYRLIAEHLVSGDGFSILAGIPDLLRTPGYPLLLAASLALFGSVVPALIVQQGMLVAVAWLAASLGRALGVGRVGQCFIAAFVLFEPASWFLSLQTLSETMAMLLALVFFGYASHVWTPRVCSRAGTLGILGALLILVKPNLALAVALGISASSFYAARARIRSLLASVLLIMVLLTPWLARNYALTGHVVLSSSFPVNLVIGFGTADEVAHVKDGPAIYDTKGRRGFAFTSFTAAGYESASRLAHAILARRSFWSLVREQFIDAPSLWFGHPYDSLLEVAGIALTAQAREAITLVDTVSWSLLLAFFITGLWHGTRRHGIAALSAVLVFASVLLPNLSISYYRMLVPLYPLIAVFACAGAEYVRMLGMRVHARVAS